MGRKKLPENEKQQHQRIPVYKETHVLIKKKSKKAGKPMTVWLDEIVKSAK